MGKPAYNHVSLYMGPGEHIDFGRKSYVVSPQPLAKPVRTTKYKAEIKQLVVWRITKTADAATLTMPPASPV